MSSAIESTAGGGNKPGEVQHAPDGFFNCTVKPKFIWTWLTVLLVLGAVLPIIPYFWVNYFSSVDVGWIDCLYKQKTEIASRKTVAGQRKIVLVGGSGTLFSIDAELIEAKLRVPTVNFGLHAGLGLPYLLHRASGIIQPNDIVVLCPEYGAWEDTRHQSGGLMMPYTLTYDRDYLHTLGAYETYLAMWRVPTGDYYDSWFGHRNNSIDQLQKTSNYNIASLSQNGDIHVAPPVKKPFKMDPLFPYPPADSGPSIKAFREFCQQAKQNHEQLLYTWPAFADPGTKIDAGKIATPKWMTDLLTETGVQVLDSPMDNAYPASWFIDTSYHTNPVARRVRTESLIRKLRTSLGLPPAADKPSAVYLVSGDDHFITAGNTFANDPNVMVKNLVAEKCENSSAITPDQVADLVKNNVPVLTDSSAAIELLAKANLAIELKDKGQTTFVDWVKQYPSSLILLSGGAGHAIPPGCGSVLSESAAKAINSDQAFAIISGTGDYSKTQRIISNPSAAKLDETLATVLPELKKIPAKFVIEGGSHSRISVDFNEFVHSDTEVCAVAIDPVLATVLDKRTFSSAYKIDTWTLNRVIFKTR